MWWSKTIERWKGEGLPDRLNSVFDIHDYFGLDRYMQFWFSTTDPTMEAVQHYVEGIVSNMDDYLGRAAAAVSVARQGYRIDTPLGRTADSRQTGHKTQLGVASE